jgi:hypothetical protein
VCAIPTNDCVWQGIVNALIQGLCIRISAIESEKMIKDLIIMCGWHVTFKNIGDCKPLQHVNILVGHLPL